MLKSGENIGGAAEKYARVWAERVWHALCLYCITARTACQEVLNYCDIKRTDNFFCGGEELFCLEYPAWKCRYFQEPYYAGGMSSRSFCKMRGLGCIIYIYLLFLIYNIFYKLIFLKLLFFMKYSGLEPLYMYRVWFFRTRWSRTWLNRIRLSRTWLDRAWLSCQGLSNISCLA